MEKPPSKERVRELVAAIVASGVSRERLAAVLGYRSHQSVRNHEDGAAAMPPDKARRLESYARHRAKIAALEARWHEQNPLA